jgi:hypothetical protein
MVVHKGDDVRAIFAYHDWDEDAGVIQVSGASTGPWSTRGMIRNLGWYPFKCIGCQLVVLRLVDPENEKLLKLFRKAGCRSYYIPRLRGRDKADVLLTMTEEDWNNNPIMKGEKK